MITTVNPCVAVNDGVSDFGPKVHLRGIKAQYTQTWWLRPPPFLIKGLLAYSWMPMLFILVIPICSDIYFAYLPIYPSLTSLVCPNSLQNVGRPKYFGLPMPLTSGLSKTNERPST